MTAHPLCECGHIEADHKGNPAGKVNMCRALGCVCQQFLDMSEDPRVPDAEMERDGRLGRVGGIE